MSLSIIIIEKGGSLKTLTVKEYNESELYKKCGFKKDDGFAIRTEWSKIKIDGNLYSVSVFAKINGKANMENKYDFPPPIDNDLYFGSCALVCKIKDIESGDYTYCPLTIDLWNKIYEKLFGGFENLADTCYEDEHEVDELANIGITTYFIVTGGAIVPFVDAVGRSSKTEHYCFQHEQAAAMAAEGYYRASGKVGAPID